MTEPVIRFFDESLPCFELSNFSPHGFTVDGVFWPTVEHYFQAQKFPGSPYQEIIRAAATPAEAKRLGQGRHLPLRPDWAGVRESVMKRALKLKFADPRLQALLLSTGDRLLVEASVEDAFWGCGADGGGLNRAGALLMEVRQEARFRTGPDKEKEMPQEVNYDEAKVPTFVLPDPLVAADGSPVRDGADWTTRRRPELLRLFEEEVFGRAPGHPEEMTFENRGPVEFALNGLGIRKQVTILLTGNRTTVPVEVLIYLPAGHRGRVPLFLGLNFYGNHTVQDDPGVKLPTSWLPDRPEVGIVDHKATEAGRGKAASRWPVPRILGRGFGVATAYCGDLDPDYDDGFANGVHPLFYRAGQQRPAPEEWGTIGAWAWGLSRILDYLETDPEVDAGRVAVLGHSRLGKTALWAGASDPRFAAVISNNSGCGGAALSRRGVGETVARINDAFPHWFCAHFRRYNDHEELLPVDQHELLALIAPRPVYVASASEDLWADPRGEFLSAFHADPVYRLLGVEGMAAKEMPGIEKPVTSRIGYHLRRGPHDVTDYDWDRYMDFVERHVGR